MLKTIFATKLGMTQAWTKNGKRIAVTKCKVGNNSIITRTKTAAFNPNFPHTLQQPCIIFEIGYGRKKLKNMAKPLAEKMTQSGFSHGCRQIKGVKVFLDDKTEDKDLGAYKPGSVVKVDQVLEVGDVVKVQGVSKGRGFAGVIKRHGFHGGPRTHGQSDRERAPGSIGAGTDPGRVWPGKKMPGHYGVENKTVTGLVVLYIDQETSEVWLTGPVPGFNSSTVRITKTGDKKKVELDLVSAGLSPAENVTEEKVEKTDKKEIVEPNKSTKKESKDDET